LISCGWGGAEILGENVAKAPELGAETTVESVVGVAGVTGLVGRNPVILEMRGRNGFLVVRTWTALYAKVRQAI